MAAAVPAAPAVPAPRPCGARRTPAPPWSIASKGLSSSPSSFAWGSPGFSRSKVQIGFPHLRRHLQPLQQGVDGLINDHPCKVLFHRVVGVEKHLPRDLLSEPMQVTGPGRRFLLEVRHPAWRLIGAVAPPHEER